MHVCRRARRVSEGTLHFVSPENPEVVAQRGGVHCDRELAPELHRLGFAPEEVGRLVTWQPGSVADELVDVVERLLGSGWIVDEAVLRVGLEAEANKVCWKLCRLA